LAAAGLRRHLDDAASLFEQLGRGEADRGANEIDQASGEKGDARPSARLNRHEDIPDKSARRYT
jgi:hypothetical protein